MGAMFYLKQPADIKTHHYQDKQNIHLFLVADEPFSVLLTTVSSVYSTQTNDHVAQRYPEDLQVYLTGLVSISAVYR